MSVMIIETSEINTYRNQFINSLNLFNLVQTNEHYTKAAKHYFLGYNPDKDKKELFVDMIDTMLWYANCANITAYNLQYKENVPFEFGFEFDDKMKAYTKKGENHNFGSLLYNVASNSGTVMMQNDFYELAYQIYNVIKKGLFENDKPLNEPEKLNEWAPGHTRKQIVAPAKKDLEVLTEVAEKVLVKTDQYDKEIANTILSQIGGYNRVNMMVGLKNLVVIKNGLIFGIMLRAAKANYIKITLNGSDLYDIEFSKVWGKSHKKINTLNNVYCDQLIQVIEENTACLLHM